MAGDRRSLLIATDSYVDASLAGLRAPAGDAAALAEVLADPAIGHFETPTVLVNRPTEEIKQELEGFFDAAIPSDFLLLYVSGHGVIAKDGRLYFATTNTRLDRLRATGIGEGFVNEVMEHSRARSIVLVLDCCHSGAFARGLVPKGGTDVDADQRFVGQGRVILTASDALEYAFEETATGAAEATDRGSLAPGSVFTRHLVDGLTSGDADIDGDGKIVLDELYQYLYRKVREDSPNQTPSKSGSGHGEILIARNPGSLPAELLSLVSSSSPEARFGAVEWLDGLARSTDPHQSLAALRALENLKYDDSRRVSDRVRLILDRPVGIGEPAAGKVVVTSAPARRQHPGSATGAAPEPGQRLASATGVVPERAGTASGVGAGREQLAEGAIVGGATLVVVSTFLPTGSAPFAPHLHNLDLWFSTGGYGIPVSALALAVIACAVAAFRLRRTAAIPLAAGLSLLLLGLTFPMSWIPGPLPSGPLFWLGAAGAGVAAAGAVSAAWWASSSWQIVQEYRADAIRPRAMWLAMTLAGPVVVILSLFVLSEWRGTHTTFTNWHDHLYGRYPATMITLAVLALSLTVRGVWTKSARLLAAAAGVACLMLGEAVPLVYVGPGVGGAWGPGRWLRIAGAVIAVIALCGAIAATRKPRASPVSDERSA